MWKQQTPRKLAIAEGRARYFSGKPCPNGHIAERMVSTRACCGCLAMKMGVWRATNPDKVNAQKRNWRSKNIDKARRLNLENQKLHRDSANERNRRYAETHREALRAKNAAWAAANPSKCTAKASRRRAALLRATPSWADQEAITGMYELAQVFRRIGLAVEVDHAIPLQGKRVSGFHVAENLQLIHSTVNKSKSNDFAIL